MKISWNISDKDYRKLIAKTVMIPENNIHMETFLKPFATSNKDTDENLETTLEFLFLGGSITMGYSPEGMIQNCYTTIVSKYLKDLIHVNSIQIHNLGYSSFHSILGLSVLERNLTNFHTNICILEYGINNGFERDYVTSFEGIVQKLLSCFPSIAIIIVSALNKEGYTCEPYMKEIASYYHLPHVSLSTAINSFPDYGLNWEDYAIDLGHPHQDGHIFLSDCINYILKSTFDNLTTKFLNPINLNPFNTLQLSQISKDTSACFGNSFASSRYYDASSMPNFVFDSFQSAQTHLMFPCGIVNTKKSNTPCILKVHCKTLYLLYEQSNQMNEQGQIHVKVSPINKEYYIDSYSIYTWGNPVSFKLIDGPLQDYTINFKILAGDIEKNFTILGFLFVD